MRGLLFLLGLAVLFFWLFGYPILVFYGVCLLFLAGFTLWHHLGTRAWRALADAHDLESDLEISVDEDGDGMMMEGRYRGEDVRVETVQKTASSGSKYELTYSVYEVELPWTIPGSLSICAETFPHEVRKLGRRLRVLVSDALRRLSAESSPREADRRDDREDIEVGRPTLDDALIIRGAEPAEIRELLDRDAVEEAFVELVRRHDDNFELENRKLRLEHWGLKCSRASLEAVLDPMAECAKALREA